jgi:G3E family GTPase
MIIRYIIQIFIFRKKMAKMIKIDIISGFLGAGKTTLIAKLLKESFKDEKVILIENEFGEIGIDSGFLKSTGIEIREMNSGCICCSLVGDFGAALKEVCTKYSPDRVIIEPSGVGKLSDVIKAVQKAEDIEGKEVKINCATAVVDVTKCKIYLKNFGEFYEDQIEAAGTIILTRTDLEKATQDKVDEAVALIREHNKTAAIVTTPIEELEAGKLVAVMERGGEDLEKQMLEELKHEHHHHDGECCCGHDHDHDHEQHHDHDEEHEHHHHHDGECCCGHDHDHEHEHHHHHDGECCCGHDHHHHHADEVFTSWGKETSRKYTREKIHDIVEELSNNDEYGVILRAKGIVPADDGTWIYFDMVPGEADVREGEPEFTGRLCVIGAKLNEDKINKLFFGK